MRSAATATVAIGDRSSNRLRFPEVVARGLGKGRIAFEP